MQVVKFATNLSGGTKDPAIESTTSKLSKMDTNSILVNKIIQVKDSMPWVRSASGNVCLVLSLSSFWLALLIFNPFCLCLVSFLSEYEKTTTGWLGLSSWPLSWLQHLIRSWDSLLDCHQTWHVGVSWRKYEKKACLTQNLLWKKLHRFINK